MFVLLFSIWVKDSETISWSGENIDVVVEEVVVLEVVGVTTGSTNSRPEELGVIVSETEYSSPSLLTISETVISS